MLWVVIVPVNLLDTKYLKSVRKGVKPNFVNENRTNEACKKKKTFGTRNFKEKNTTFLGKARIELVSCSCTMSQLILLSQKNLYSTITHAELETKRTKRKYEISILTITSFC